MKFFDAFEFTSVFYKGCDIDFGMAKIKMKMMNFKILLDIIILINEILTKLDDLFRMFIAKTSDLDPQKLKCP